MAQRILIVEDEEKLRDVMGLFMKSEGFEVETAASGEEALELFAGAKPDLIILDAMLPGISGFDVCRKIRETSDVKIIFLTALGDDDHHMLAYRLGADDYLAKPFKISILVMKIKRMLREVEPAKLSFNEIELEPDSQVCRAGGEVLELTPKEFLLLRQFLANPGRVLTRDTLLRNVWGYDYTGDSRVVDTVVKNLRKKLGGYSKYIRTVIAVGYKLEDQT